MLLSGSLEHKLAGSSRQLPHLDSAILISTQQAPEVSGTFAVPPADSKPQLPSKAHRLGTELQCKDTSIMRIGDTDAAAELAILVAKSAAELQSS